MEGGVGEGGGQPISGSRPVPKTVDKDVFTRHTGNIFLFNDWQTNALNQPYSYSFTL
jgi:hypothetical protein